MIDLFWSDKTVDSLLTSDLCFVLVHDLLLLFTKIRIIHILLFLLRLKLIQKRFVYISIYWR